MKTYSKIVFCLLVLSLIWLYLILNLAYFTFFQEACFFMPKIDVSIQFNVVYVLGILISICYLKLIYISTHSNF